MVCPTVRICVIKGLKIFYIQKKQSFILIDMGKPGILYFFNAIPA
jgi:hypothetical protein